MSNPKDATATHHLARVRRICEALPETTEKLSHGEPTFFVRKKVYAMFSNNHHGDGHVSVLVPAPEGLQEFLIGADPKKYYRPPYVGHRGWIGIELDLATNAELEDHIHTAWELIAPKRVRERFRKD